MTRRRGIHNGSPIASTYQYAPEQLLYSSKWNKLSLTQVVDRIKAAMSNEARIAWVGLTKARLLNKNEHDALEAIKWIIDHGRKHGIRTPTVQERSRAFGMENYLKALGLPEPRLYDAQGNMFDKDAFIYRIEAVLQAWLVGETELTNIRPLGIEEIVRVFNRLKAHAEGLDWHVRSSPWPDDLSTADILATIEAAKLDLRFVQYMLPHRGARGRAASCPARGTRTRPSRG